MVSLSPPLGPFGTVAPDFQLSDPNGQTYTLADIRGENGTLVMFICNHCPYVQAVIDRIVRDCRALEGHGVKAVAVMSNDVAAYPEDGPEYMRGFATQHGFGFPYLYDETQMVARAYGAVCTPDFFGYDAALKLCYRGRLDASGRQPADPDTPRELFDAMVQIALGGGIPDPQMPSIGCSIKWKSNAAD